MGTNEWTDTLHAHMSIYECVCVCMPFYFLPRGDSMANGGKRTHSLSKQMNGPKRVLARTRQASISKLQHRSKTRRKPASWNGEYRHGPDNEHPGKSSNSYATSKHREPRLIQLAPYLSAKEASSDGEDRTSRTKTQAVIAQVVFYTRVLWWWDSAHDINPTSTLYQRLFQRS